MDYKRSWRLRRWDVPVTRILSRFYNRYDEIYVSVVLTTMYPADPAGRGWNAATLFVKIAEGEWEHTHKPDGSLRRIVETQPLWHLPGMFCFGDDPTLLQRAWAEVYSQLGLEIKKFKKVIDRTIVTVDGADNTEWKVLVLTIAAEHDHRMMNISAARYSDHRWVTAVDLENDDFHMR